MAIRRTVSLAVLMLASGMTPAVADMAAAEKWVNDEFQPSTLSKADQLKEMEWFVNAAKPFAGMEVNVLSETIPTHEYESKILTKAFEEITGIKVNHQLLGEGEVVQAVQTQMQTNRSLYDAYINDSDLIGTHSRLQSAVNLTDWMAGEGKDVTNPGLDIDDFIGKSFTTGPDGKLWQLPDQQFANLYWFRKDWFDDKKLQAAFKKKYGYDLGVPVNWSAYEDIAEFFTNDVKEIGGVKVYGHMDYGKRAPDLGWRMTDAWLSMAGAGSAGLPNGRPIDEWGIRMEEGSCNPAGASVIARRRDQRPSRGLRDREVGRVAAQVCASGRCRLRLLPVAAGSQPGQRGPADLLVHRLHRVDGGPEVGWQQHRGRRRQAALADGPVAARRVLEGRPEARLSGCRLLDSVQVDAGRERARRPGSMPSSSPRRRST